MVVTNLINFHDGRWSCFQPLRHPSVGCAAGNRTSETHQVAWQLSYLTWEIPA